MRSKRLNQKMCLAVDKAAAKGPFTVQDAVNNAKALITDEDWALADIHVAKHEYLTRSAKAEMTQTISPHFCKTVIDPTNVHGAMLKNISKLPRTMCITAGAGPNSQWISVEKATREHWQANIALKNRMAMAVQFSMGDAREILELLFANGADCLADLGKQEAA